MLENISGSKRQCDLFLKLEHSGGFDIHYKVTMTEQMVLRVHYLR